MSPNPKKVCEVCFRQTSQKRRGGEHWGGGHEVIQEEENWPECSSSSLLNLSPSVTTWTWKYFNGFALKTIFYCMQNSAIIPWFTQQLSFSFEKKPLWFMFLRILHPGETENANQIFKFRQNISKFVWDFEPWKHFIAREGICFISISLCKQK